MAFFIGQLYASGIEYGIQGKIKINVTNNTPLAPGIHLLVDYWGAQYLKDITAIEAAFRQAVVVCGANLLHIHLHSFGENSGVTGVAILAESHMSIHTWPEIDYLALDIFMCGACNPYLALQSLNDFFKPQQIKITEQKRGTL